MKELKTVKQLKEFLEDFSDDCKVYVVVDALQHPIVEYGWSSGGEDEPGTSVEVSMKLATELDLFISNEREHE